MKTIEYYKETKDYFKKFLQSNNNDNLLHYYNLYENNIKTFIEYQLGWNINIYFSRIVNSKPNYIEWFYVIDNGIGVYSSDEYEYNKMISYELALNNAIQCVFKNIYSINI